MSSSQLVSDASAKVSESPLEGRRGRCSNLLAVFNVVNTSIGLGVVKLPAAMMRGGWLGGTFLLFTSYIMTAYCTCLFYKALVSVEGAKAKGCVSVEELGLKLFGRAGQVGFWITLYSFVGVLLIVLLCIFGDALATVLPSSLGLSLSSWTVVGGALVLPLSWLPTMAEVGVVSAVGVFSIFCVVGIAVAGSFHVGVTEGFSEEQRLLPLSFSDFSNCFSVFVFSYCCTFTTPNVVRDMRTPGSYPSVVGISLAIIFGVYLLLSVAGFSVFGDSLADYDTILKAISPSEESPSSFAFTLQSAAVVMASTSYMIAFAPLGYASDRMLGVEEMEKGRKRTLFLVLGRSSAVVVTVFLAVMVPRGKVGPLLSILAALNGTAMTLLIPIACYWRTLQLNGERHPSRLKLLFEVFMVVIGLFGAGVGTVAGVKEALECWG